MILLAIDPGNVQSAYVVYDTANERPISWEKVANEVLLERLDNWVGETVVIEMVASYGMPVGREVFETCVWIGRFFERVQLRFPVKLLYRLDVKLFLCKSGRHVTDAHIRQALIDKFGPGKELAIGKKATPGPLYGMSGDAWAALGVAVTAAADYV